MGRPNVDSRTIPVGPNVSCVSSVARNEPEPVFGRSVFFVGVDLNGLGNGPPPGADANRFSYIAANPAVRK